MASRAAEPASRGSGGGPSPGKLSPGPGLDAKNVAAHQLARIHKATIGIVAESGYEALKVRDVVNCAEVSTRAFYELFKSKEDCFLRTCELISRRATQRIIAAQVGELDWRKRPRLVFEEFVRELERAPDRARLALIEAYAAGEVSLEQAYRTERIFEEMLAETFARTPDGMAVPSLLVEGMVAGIASVSRSHLAAGKVSELWNARDELVEWALSYAVDAASELADLDRQSVWRDTTLEPPVTGLGGEPWPRTGDRALILGAVAELAAKHGYAKLTAPRVRSAAGVSRRKFETHFDDLEECYLAALEQRAGEAMSQASRAQAAATSWQGGVYRATAALCEHLASDPLLARVCLTGDFPPGLNGARSRERLIEAVTELLSLNGQGAPMKPNVVKASTGAIWALLTRHLIREKAFRRQISATLSYLAIAPTTDAATVVAAVRSEQSPNRN